MPMHGMSGEAIVAAVGLLGVVAGLIVAGAAVAGYAAFNVLRRIWRQAQKEKKE